MAMRFFPALPLLLVFFLPVTPNLAGGHGGSSCASHSHSYPTVARDSHGHIKRDPAARASFQHQNPCPSAGKTSGICPGYVVDDVTSLIRGGADSPSNMQWQTKEAAKEKGKWE